MPFGEKPRFGIIGGGPAGLSLARMLRESGLGESTVFEALPQVGGKSFTVYEGANVIEMGTCYATFSHRITNKWMRDYKMPMLPLREQRFDGADFMDYIKSGSGPILPLQVLRYRAKKARLEKALSQPKPPQWAIEDAARPIIEWLDKYNLGKIEHFMHRSTTNIAYGFVDWTPTVQALRWNDMDLIYSGLLKQLKMPKEGWAKFWRKVSAELDVRLNTRISQVERGAHDVTLVTEQGERHTFDYVICAIPVDDFSQMTPPSEDETYVNDAVIWNGYTTTLFAAENWFTDVHVEAYKEAVIPGADLGQLLSARHDGYEKDLGGHLYLSGQLSGDYTGPELAELLRDNVAQKGATVTNVILQKMWKYFARYDPDAIRDGLLARLEAMQGQNRTFYTGATFSHEAVSHIVTYNAGLVERMKLDINAH